MKTVYDARRENLARLLAELGAKTALAIKLDVTQGRISHLLTGRRQIHEDVARQIEKVIGLEVGALDAGSNGNGPPPKPRLTAAPGNVDASLLLEEAVRVVINAAINAHTKPVADKTAGIVKLVYEQAQASGQVDPAYAAELVKLMR